MRKEVFAGVACSLCFVCSLPFCLDSGYYWFSLFDSYTASLAVFVAILGEVYFIAWRFGIERLNALVKHKTGEHVPKWITIFNKFVVPAFIVLLVVLWFIDEFRKDGRIGDDYKEDDKIDWPYGILWLARFIIVFELAWIAFGYFVRIECENVYEIVKRDDGVDLASDEFVNGKKETEMVDSNSVV